MPAVVSFATMPSDPTQPEETGSEDESPEDEAQRSAGYRHGGFDEGRPYRVTNPPTVEPEVTEDESMLVDEYGERGESPGRK